MKATTFSENYTKIGFIILGLGSFDFSKFCKKSDFPNAVNRPRPKSNRMTNHIPPTKMFSFTFLTRTCIFLTFGFLRKAQREYIYSLSPHGAGRPLYGTAKTGFQLTAVLVTGCLI